MDPERAFKDREVAARLQSLTSARAPYAVTAVYEPPAGTPSPGPWRAMPVSPRPDGAYQLHDARGDLIAYVVPCASPHQNAANVRLLAAAAELVDALQQIAWLADAEQPVSVRAAAIARDAIAKATGEQP